MFQLTIQLPQDERQCEVPGDQRQRLVSHVLRSMSLPLNTRCGQRGLCNGCLVHLLEGFLEDAQSGALIGPQAAPLRGCQVRVPLAGQAAIHVPARSLLAHQPQVVSSFRLNVPRAHDPLWQSFSVRREDLAFGGRLSLSDSLVATISAELDCDLPIRADASLACLQPNPLDRYHVVLEHRGDHRLLHGPTIEEPAYGVAVDIGTTTVVVALVELATGRVVSNASALNAQTRLGDNVLTRINICMTQPHMVQRMQTAVVRRTLVPLLMQAIEQAGIRPQQLACLVAAGNMTMLHLLLGVNPSSMGTAPFTPTFLDHDVVTAAELALALPVVREEAQQQGDPEGGTDENERQAGDDGNTADTQACAHQQLPKRPARSKKFVPQLAIHLLPGAAAYVGADITAGILASGMAYREETSLLVDLGTNGELVLRHAAWDSRRSSDWLRHSGRTGLRRSWSYLRNACRSRGRGTYLAGSRDPYATYRSDR